MPVLREVVLLGPTTVDRIDLVTAAPVESLTQAATIDDQLAVLRSRFTVELMQPAQRFDPEFDNKGYGTERLLLEGRR